MTWLLKAMRWREVVLAAVITGTTAAVLRGRNAPVPSLTAGDIAPVPLVAVFALIPVAVVLRAWEGIPPTDAASAARPAWVQRLALVAATWAILALTGGACGGIGTTLEILRNATGLMSLAVVGQWIAGARTALALPVSYLLVAFLLGRGATPNSTALWAWVLRDGGSATSYASVGLLVVVAAILLPTLPQRELMHGSDRS